MKSAQFGLLFVIAVASVVHTCTTQRATRALERLDQGPTYEDRAIQSRIASSLNVIAVELNSLNSKLECTTP